MSWSDRQSAMLDAMGLRLWRRLPADVGQTAASPPDPLSQAMRRPDRPSNRGAAQLGNQPVPPHPVSATYPSAQAGTMVDANAMDWPALREAVSNCQACKLCASRTQTVFGVGNERSHWMVVGEAPGEQEDLQGEPFVGTAGRLLDNMLRAIGVTRGEAPPERSAYIANTLKCRPPRNRNPEPEELARCEPFLLRQIELVRPRIILAMGRFAVQSLLRSSEPIGRLRGRVHQYHGVPLIVTYHPAYLLRNLTDKARAWEDLCLAIDTLQSNT